MGEIPPLIWAKLKWAARHAQTTSDEIARFAEREPYHFSLDVDTEKREQLFRLRTVETPPPEIALGIGDTIHNLRATLDHLAWFLALQKSPTPPRKTEFPIFWREADYLRDSPAKLRGIPTPAHTIIESVQPYHRGHEAAAKRDPLWIIHQLDIDDKHRLPTLVAMAAGGGGTWVPPRGVVEINPNPLDEGAVIMKVVFPEGIDLQVDVEPDLTFQIAFGKESAASGGHVMATLVQLGKAVEGVVRKFSDFF